MSNGIEWTKEGDTVNCLRNAKDVAACATKLKPGHWCFLGNASESTWWNATSNEPQGQRDMVALQMVDIFNCHTSHFQRQSHSRLDS